METSVIICRCQSEMRLAWRRCFRQLHAGILTDTSLINRYQDFCIFLVKSYVTINAALGHEAVSQQQKRRKRVTPKY